MIATLTPCWHRLGVLAALVLLALSTIATAPAHAGVRRYAMVVGVNHGDVDQIPLRYAERDAERLAELLVELGGVDPQDLVLLRGARASDFEQALAGINQRIAAHQRANEDNQSMLLVFYSGHAGVNGLSMRATELSFRRLKRTLARSPASLRLLIVDACQSGAITRTKGARRAQPFHLGEDERLGGEGVAIITSSAAGEDAQESERLRGGFFTHALLVGLQGAADLSGDDAVTLNEAYQYAYAETLRATSRAPNQQHPTYAFQLRGRADLVLTRLADPLRRRGRLQLTVPGTYVLFQGSAQGPIVADIAVTDNKTLVLPSGIYVLRRRGHDAIYEARLRIQPDAVRAITNADMRSIAYSDQARVRGAGAPRVRWAAVAAAGVSQELIAQTGTIGLGLLGVGVERRAWSLETNLRLGSSSSTVADTRVEQTLFGFESTGFGAFLRSQRQPSAAGWVAAFGLRLGLDRVAQRFESPVPVPGRVAWAGRAGIALRVRYDASGRWSGFVEGSLDGYRLRRDDRGQSELAIELVPHLRLGVIVHVFE